MRPIMRYRGLRVQRSAAASAGQQQAAPGDEEHREGGGFRQGGDADVGDIHVQWLREIVPGVGKRAALADVEDEVERVVVEGPEAAGTGEIGAGGGFGEVGDAVERPGDAAGRPVDGVGVIA